MTHGRGVSGGKGGTNFTNVKFQDFKEQGFHFTAGGTGITGLNIQVTGYIHFFLICATGYGVSGDQGKGTDKKVAFTLDGVGAEITFVAAEILIKGFNAVFISVFQLYELNRSNGVVTYIFKHLIMQLFFELFIKMSTFGHVADFLSLKYQ